MTKETQKEKPKGKKAENDCWMYNKDGGKLFAEGDNIPSGYVDTPAKVK